MDLFPFHVKRLLMNLFQEQFAPLHYVSLLCIILHEKSTPTYANRRYLVLFFSASKKTVIATKTDLVTYHLYLYFAIERKALKNYFSYNKQLG